jgi:hypothetical protein
LEKGMDEDEKRIFWEEEQKKIRKINNYQELHELKTKAYKESGID